MKNINLKIKLFALLLIFSSFSLHAAAKIDYYQLAKSGTLKEIKNAIKANSGLVNQKFGDNKASFLMLVLNCDRDLEIVNQCLKSGCKINDATSDKITPMMFACQYESHGDVIERILSFGASSKAAKRRRLLEKDSYGKSSIDYAKLNAKFDSLSIISQYLEEGDLPKDSDAKNHTISITYDANGTGAQVSQKESEDTTEKKVTVLDSVDSNKARELALAKENDSLKKEAAPSNEVSVSAKDEGASSKVADLSVKDEGASSKDEGSSVKDVDSSSKEVAASTKGTSSSSKEVASSTKEVNSPTKEDTTSSTSSTKKSDSQKSLSSGQSKSPSITYDVSQKGSDGLTLLMKAAKAGNDWDLENLIKNGSDVNARDSDGWTALMYAARYSNSLTVFQTLVNAGADKDAKSVYSATPLLLAADYSQNPKIIESLLSGKNKNDAEVINAFILAVTSTEGPAHVRKTKIKLFLDKGLSVNTIWKGKTPLMYAALYTDDTEIISYLLDCGAVKDLCDERGKSAFDYAKENSKLKHDSVFYSLDVSSKK